MGLSSSTPEPLPSLLNRRAPSNLTSPSAYPTTLLSEFRQQLTIPQCGYVLTTLLQQYFLLLKSKVIVTVNDHLCRVTDQGQLLVFSWNSRNEQEETSSNYINTFAKIVEVTESLAEDSEALWSSALGCLKSRILSILFQSGRNEQSLNYLLQKQIHTYFQSEPTEVNLQWALTRLLKDSDRVLLKHHKRYQSAANLNPSFGTANFDYSHIMQQMNSNSNKQSRFNKHPHKQYFQTTSQHFNEINQFELQTPLVKDSISSIPIKQSQCRTNKIHPSQKCCITCLYSISIVTCSPEPEPEPAEKQKQNKKPIQSKTTCSCIRKKKRYATQDLRFSCPQSNDKIHKNNTSINLRSPNTEDSQKYKAGRSNLWTMARVVEVREEPSSKAIIY